MATLDEIRLQQLLKPFNNQTGIMSSNNAIPMINNVPMINTGAVDQDLQNTDLIQQLILQNQQKLNLANTADTAPFFFPQINNQVPQINNEVPQINNQVPFNDFYDSVYEPYDEEKDNEQVDKIPGQFSLKDSLSGMGRKFGLSSLLGLITGNPIIGLLSRGIGALANRAGPALNDFKSASTGAQFFKNLRDRKAREDAAARGAAKQAAAARVESFRNFDRGYGGGRDSGGTGSAGRGGASPGSAGPGGSDSMGSF